MAHDLILLWLAALALMGSPGPATLRCAAIGAAFGARAGLTYLAGIATGVTGLVLAEPALVTAITILAAAYILYLAYRIATAPVLGQRPTDARSPSFPAGFVLAIANPKAFAAIGAVYSGHQLFPGDVLFDAAGKIAALVLVIPLVNTAWLIFGASFSLVLKHPIAGRIANLLFAVMLVASVALALTRS